MYGKNLVVKLLPLAMVLTFAIAPIASAGDAPIYPHMMYFYNPSCRLCTKTNEVVGEAEKKFEKSMSYQRMNIADPAEGMANVEYMFELLDVMEVPPTDNVTLVVFLGLLSNIDGQLEFEPKRVLVEGENIIPKLDAEIADFLANEGEGGKPYTLVRPSGFFSATALASLPPTDHEVEPPAGDAGGAAPLRPAIRRPAKPQNDDPAPEGAVAPAPSRNVSDVTKSRAETQLQFWTVSGAALADSINPCAFATIIILVAMMSSAKRTRREIIAVCLSFTAAVYVTYFAIGLFLYKIIAMINEAGGGFLIVADCIYYLAFLICLVFGFLSLFDFYRLYRGKAAEEMVLQLPKAFKKRINLAMAKGVRARWLVVGVFIAGVTVSFFEAACTGQVYLPIIISMAKMNLASSLALLAWYNFLFILPLLLIFVLVIWGVTSHQLANFFKKNVAWTRLTLGIIFLVMGYIIWHEMYWPPGYRG